MKVAVYRAFIVTEIFIQPVRLCCRSQVSLVGPILRISVPASNQVGRLLNRFDVRICADRYDLEYLYSKSFTKAGNCIFFELFLPTIHDIICKKSLSIERLKMKNVYCNSDPAFTEIEFWSNGEIEVSRTRNWSDGAFVCSEAVLHEIVDVLNNEGEALVSDFDFELDFLSNPSDPQISAKGLKDDLPIDISDQISLAISENRIEDFGYVQIDYLLWLSGDIQITDDSSHSPNE